MSWTTTIVKSREELMTLLKGIPNSATINYRWIGADQFEVKWK